ncbi:MAG: DUF2807 domain-containing protein [Crocinitomicaceae bacterium]|nr:DUF2807 domain-containing protein [Crocinitomicaceae bacterium]
MVKRKTTIGIFFLLLVFVSCKKKDERSCWKGNGVDSSLEIPLDSVDTWNMFGSHVKYHIFQDTSRKIVVRGGANLIKLIGVEQDGYDVTVTNNNKCHFLRDPDKIVEVEIHYPHLRRFFFEPSDSVIFEGTVVSDSLIIQIAHAGGSMVLDVDTEFTKVVVSRGTGNYVLSGNSNIAEVKVQDKGFGDATNFTANSIFVYQNSTADLWVNLEGANAQVDIDGSGDVHALGQPNSLVKNQVGSGQFIPY